MNTALFIKSYAADFGFLSYCLRSISKFVSGISEVVIAVQKEDVLGLKAMGLSMERIEIVPRYTSDGYLDQEIHKLVAYRYTDARRILYFDSDCIAIRKFSPEDLIVDGKPRCLMTPYSKLVKDDGTPDTPWQPITEKAIGQPVAFEYMRSHPMIVDRRALIDLDCFTITKHGVNVETYITRQPARAFSEWNYLHAWAHLHAPDYFSFWNTEEKGVPQPFVRQGWSWGGVTEDERRQMEEILK